MNKETHEQNMFYWVSFLEDPDEPDEVRTFLFKDWAKAVACLKQLRQDPDIELLEVKKIEIIKAYPHFLLCRACYGKNSYNFCINKADLITREVQFK